MGTRPIKINANPSGIGEPEESAWERMNRLGAAGIPFLFLTDFKGEQLEVFDLAELEREDIFFDIEGVSNREREPVLKNIYFEKYPIPIAQYRPGFNLVKKHLLQGDSYLVNYTCATPVKTNLSLREIYCLSEARYKVLYKNKFTFFSPETFVKIKDGKISTFPMKGTIDASIPNARDIILGDKKETAEHHTIVDLLRNDLSRVSRQVQVERFRYVEEIKTREKHLLQISSEITGQLQAGWKNNLGNIFKELLPAGSISGAPKKKTIEIIGAAEGQERGFYTGIVGWFDGEKVDSGVAIRFIENTKNGLQFRSGGGVTCFSEMEMEYQEMIDKVYLTKGLACGVPVANNNTAEREPICS
ncbi:MAG: aminodeoxychorismate synthase component I [Bacteroidota bacterium]